MNSQTAVSGASAETGVAAIVRVLVVLALTLPGVQWLATSQTIWAVSLDQLPKGQILYLLSKLAALYAIAVFTLQLSYGIAGARARSMLGVDLGLRFHRALGFGVLFLLLAHAGLFIGAVSVRAGHFASQYALPDLFGGYYVSRIALGWWAGVGVLLAMTVALCRAQLKRVWRFAHWLSIPAAAAVVVHSWSIGTESRMPIMLIAYLCMGALLFLATYLRFQFSANSRNSVA